MMVVDQMVVLMEGRMEDLRVGLAEAVLRQLR
jgi:hypothetical protein